MSETFDPKLNGRVMRRWSTSLAGIGGANFECVAPLLPWEREHVLEWLELIRKQIARVPECEAAAMRDDKEKH